MGDHDRAAAEQETTSKTAGGHQPRVARAPISADAQDLPASGAWREGDPLGSRPRVPVSTGRPFALEGGGHLDEVQVAYETWGVYRGTNAVLICHALTGDSHATSGAAVVTTQAGWWEGLIGPGRAIDTDRWFVVCANVLGGCQGSTGPASCDPRTGAPYGGGFPVVTIRDMVRTQALLADKLGIDRWRSVVGGSMGGMQVLEWGIMYPHRVDSLMALATCAAATAQQVAYSSVERSAIAMDPAFAGGDYYDAGPGGGPHQGLALARQIAQITYRSDAVFTERFGRGVLDPLDGGFELWHRFDVEGYLDYQGAKLVRRFDANSYLRLSKAMDLHDVGRGRGGVARALGRLACPVLTMGIATDALYYREQQLELARTIQQTGGSCTYVDIDSPHGHDAFLLESEQMTEPVRTFLEGV